MALILADPDDLTTWCSVEPGEACPDCAEIAIQHRADPNAHFTSDPPGSEGSTCRRRITTLRAIGY